VEQYESKETMRGCVRWVSSSVRKTCWQTPTYIISYFEWLKKGKDRLPHFIRRKDNRLLIMAGLYDSVILEGMILVSSSALTHMIIYLFHNLGTTDELWTFTVVTTDSSQALSWLHDRQPVILSSTEQLEAWLDTSKGWHSGLINILKPGDGSDLQWYVLDVQNFHPFQLNVIIFFFREVTQCRKRSDVSARTLPNSLSPFHSEKTVLKPCSPNNLLKPFPGLQV
jgi:hypothetical protein